MSQQLAAHPGDACFDGFKHSGTAKGEILDIAGVKAYVSLPPSKSTDKAILHYSDIHGPHFINNKLIADFFAEHGYVVIAPDYFEGDDLTELRKNPDFDRQGWSKAKREAAPRIIATLVPAIKEKYNPKAIASVGYCFGGPYVLKDLATGLATAGAIAHPASLTDDDFRAVKAPIFLSCAETDGTFPAESRHKAEEILVEKKASYHFQLFSGVSHGFAVRGDPDDENERWAKETSAWGIIGWFNRFLK